ncbi:FG-GAP-like repeat-containing protein [Aureitalea marina]|uniref:FG-GAP-like repeat-containing protein n=1 Tax=Aureitalea marina TaxID=930804 RepID=UPI0015E33AB8|nr:FG-GAP-like repeat-containing protein [Aureitalea marina]
MDVELFNFLTYTMDFVPQYMFNSLSLNRGAGYYSEIAHMSGIAKTDWSWATLMMDLDNDTYKDLIITNGFKRDTKNQDWKTELNARYEAEGQTMEVYWDQLQKADSKPIPNYVYRNDGALKFEDKVIEWGFEDPSFSNGAAYGDLDNDGDLDVVVNNLESPAFVYRNNTSEKGQQNYIQLELLNNGLIDRVYNSKVRLYAGGTEQIIEYSFSRGYYSSMQPLAHFGIGTKQRVDRIEVEWPDGQTTTLENPAINTKHTIDRSKVAAVSTSTDSESKMFLDIIPQVPSFDFAHQENEYNDFAREILLPHKQSTLGPALAVGDVNGDGVDDFYMGGAKDQAGVIYVQNPAQGLLATDQPILNRDSGHEDVGATFFDADSDGDLDLLVSSGGGGEFRDNSLLLQDRLYMNDGSGNFTRSSNGLPRMISSTGVVRPFDFDADGDLDLFIGGRTTPGKYPEAPRSYLLENNNGKFADKTDELASELKFIGMVTDASWADVNMDGKTDLMLVGEWMNITVMESGGNGFENKTELYGLNQTGGWWSSIEKGDFDNDGDLDFIVGNIGENNKFHPTKAKPLHIFANDFDENGTLDIVLSKDYQGSLVPVRGKECSTEQMPFLSEKFPSYAEFASSSLTQIYGNENLEDALHYQAETFSSVYLENLANGSFQISTLAVEVQMSPVNDIVVHDFNRDGNLDVVLGGNRYNTEPETTAYDSGKGLYLFGLGDGSFIVQSDISESGLMILDNCKGLELFQLIGQRPAILVANNNSRPQLFAWTR